MTYLYTNNVSITNTSASPVTTAYANTVQLDALNRLKVSTVQDQIWYTAIVDKDSDLRFVELMTSNVIVVSATATRTNTNAIVVSSTANMQPGAVITDGSGVPYSPPTYVVSIPSSGNIILNQNVTVSNGSNITVNTNRSIATATGNQTTSNLIVSSSTGFSPGNYLTNIQPGTANALPFNTFVVSVPGPNNVVLNQTVTIASGDTIASDSANSYFNVVTSDITLCPGTRPDGSLTRQSRISHRIIPGVSHTVYQTVNWNGNDANTVKRFGLFNDKAGLYWQLTGGDSLAAVVRRTNPDGSIHEDTTFRANFNTDKLDGTGPSGFNITSSNTVALTGWNGTAVNQNFAGGYLVDYAVTPGQGNTFVAGTSITVSNVTPSTFNGTFSVSSFGTSNVTVAYPTNPSTFSTMSDATLYQSQYHKYYTWWMEFIGGRTGRVRFGLGTAAGPTIVHTYNYAGQLSTSFVTSGVLPNRWEIHNTGIPNATVNMLIAGHTFNVEAGTTANPGFGVAVSNSGFTVDGTMRPILGFGNRPMAPFNLADLQLSSIELADLSNRIVSGNSTNAVGVYRYAIYINPTITGPLVTSTNVGKASRYWQYTANNAIQADTGKQLMSGYFSSQTTTATQTIANFLNMGCDVSGHNPDQLVLAVSQTVQGTAAGNIVGAMNWVEYL